MSDTIERHGKLDFMHRVVAHGDTLYLGGVVADDVDADMRRQTEQALANLEAVLRSVGSDRTKVLSATIHLTDLSRKAEVNEVWNAWFDPEHMPARAAIGAADLGPGVLLEIVAVAAR